MTEYVTQNIRTVLKTYQSSATKSLQGPGQSLVAAAAAAAAGSAGSPTTIIKKEILSSPEPLDVNESPTLIVPPPPPPELTQPILTAADTGHGELYETRLEGKTIGCFSLGGELRLCLPQFLNNVLADFTLDQINRIFDELGIFCSQCTPDQLMEFKAAKILPSDVKASGLITRTDAERLCAALLHRAADRHQYAIDDIPKGAISFKVYHRCFGKSEGICTPDMYSYMKPACIVCIECKGWFTPQKFVGHVHRQQENRTCHWGFDSRNWHEYLHVALDVENREKYTKILDELKEMERKETLKAQRDLSYLKRKAELDETIIAAPPCKREPIDIPSKKVKSLDETAAYQLDYQRYQQALIYHCAHQQQQQQQQQRGQMSAFRPWAPKAFLPLPYSSVAALPYLSQEPPVLQNPERVVRNTESERFERTYQPNVALAPRKSILSKEREKERERERERERELERQQTQHAAITNLCEAELHIKQERPSSPDDIAQSPEEMRMPSPTPLSNNKSNNNNLNNRRHSMHSPQQPPPPSAQLHSRHLHHTPPQPISPEEFSGSNEITSSTSPIPNNNNTINNGPLSNTSPSSIQQHLQHLQLQQTLHQHHAAAHQPHRIHQHHQQHQQSPHHPHQSQSIIATINQHTKLLTTADNNNVLCLPSRIRISKNLINQSNIVRSPTPPPLAPSAANHEQYNNNKRQHHQIQQQLPSQSSASLSSNSLSAQATGAAVAAAVNLVTGGGCTNAVATGVLVKPHPHLNGGVVGTAGIIGNSEFELSTDTDDDSLNGEPDSQSNILAPWEQAADALKDTRPKDREKILQLLQKLIHDNNQIRFDNLQLIEEVRKRDEQICDLQQELQHYRRQVALLSPAIVHQKVNSSCSNSSTSSTGSSSSSNGSVIAKIDSCTSQNEMSALPPTPTAALLYQQESQLTKSENDKIKVPLKKSVRRSPEESVVVLNQNIGNADDLMSATPLQSIANEVKSESKQMPNSVNTTNGEAPPQSNSPPSASASSSTAPTSTSPMDSCEDESHKDTKPMVPSPALSSSSTSSSSSSLSTATLTPSSGFTPTTIKTEK